MTVGEVARRAGLRASTLRYYERIGLIPSPPRKSGRRDYGSDAFDHLAVVQFARACGFSIAETRQLVRGFDPRTPASARWTAATDARLREIDAQIARAEMMKDLLRRMQKCQCGTLVECGRRLRQAAQGRAVGSRQLAVGSRQRGRRSPRSL